MFKSKGSHAKRKNFSGGIVTVKDSRHGYLRNLKIKGHSYQRKNLFPIVSSRTTNGVTYTSNGDGTYTVNGTALSPYAILNFMLDVSLPLGQYFLSGRPVDGVGYLAAEGAGVSDNGAGATFTVTEPTKKYRFYYILTPGLTANNMIIKPMLRRAGTSPDFEPGDGGRFSPDAPSEILNVPSEIEVVNSSKNLFTTASFGNVVAPSVTHYMEILDLNSFTSTKNINSQYQSEGFIIEVEPSKEYNLSFDYLKELLVEGITYTSILLRIYDISYGSVNNWGAHFAESPNLVITGLTSGRVEFTFSVPENCKRIGICFNFNFQPYNPNPHGRVKMHINNVQLEQGTVSTAFAPYYRITTPLTVRDAENNEYSLCGLGDARDEVDYSTGKITKYIKERIFDGTENWIKSSVALNGYYIHWNTFPSPGVPHAPFISNIALYTSNIAEYRDVYNKAFSDSACAFNVDPNIVGSTLDEWKSWLASQYTAGNPLKIQYRLVTPEVYNLHPDEKINKPATFEGDNYITTETDNGVKPELEFNAISYE